MQVGSDSDDDEVEINPYWCRVVIYELQGLGNPMIVDETDTGSMPNLEAVSDSETSEDSVQFIYTPPPSPCSTCQRSVQHKMSGCMEHPSLLNKDYPVSLDDEGEDGHTTFNATMLVNVEGDVEGL